MSEIYNLTLCQLIEKIKSKEISCEEVTKSFINAEKFESNNYLY